MRLHIRCAVLGILWFNSNSYIKGQRSNVLTLYCTCKKRPIPSCCLAWLLRINKDSIEISDAVLFTSNNANRADVCADLFEETT